MSIKLLFCMVLALLEGVEFVGVFPAVILLVYVPMTKRVSKYFSFIQLSPDEWHQVQGLLIVSVNPSPADSDMGGSASPTYPLLHNDARLWH